MTRKEKLAASHIGSLPIVKGIGKVAYKLDIPEDLKVTHLVFHVWLLKKYLLDEFHILKRQADTGRTKSYLWRKANCNSGLTSTKVMIKGSHFSKKSYQKGMEGISDIEIRKDDEGKVSKVIW